jgi:predicted nucleic acid-binding Zn ribbon protein
MPGVRTHYKWRTVNCSVCGKAFEASRHDAAYCSSTCRTKARRAKQGKEKAIAAARQAINELVLFCGSPLMADRVNEVITWWTEENCGSELRIEFIQLNNDVSVG